MVPDGGSKTWGRFYWVELSLLAGVQGDLLAIGELVRKGPVQKHKRTQDWPPGRFDHHRPVASPRSGACRRRCRRFRFSARAGKTPSSNGMPRSRAETWIQARAAHGPERASRLRRGNLSLDSEPLGAASFPLPARSPVRARSPIWRKRGTRKSRLETKTENEALSALLARLWCHLILQNRANGAENLTRLCSATIGKTGWRMVQVGAIRSRQKAVQLLAEILKEKSKWRFRRFRVSRIY